jgi:hypothetical protein
MGSSSPNTHRCHTPKAQSSAQKRTRPPVPILQQPVNLRVVVFKEGPRSIFCYVGHTMMPTPGPKGDVSMFIRSLAPRRSLKSQIGIVRREAPQQGILAHEAARFFSAWVYQRPISNSYAKLTRTDSSSSCVDCPKRPRKHCSSRRPAIDRRPPQSSCRASLLIRSRTLTRTAASGLLAMKRP